MSYTPAHLIAEQLVNGRRRDDYDSPEDNMARVAAVWTIIFARHLRDDAHLDGTDVALAMTALKLVREAHRHLDDNIIDAHGYLIIADRIHHDRNPDAD